MKKKKGSSILMILAISAVIVMLLGTAVSAMVFTQRGNNIEKIDNDLLYAAEGGVELRISLIRKDDKYGKTILNSIDQTQIDNMEIKLKTDTVHSVETKTEEIIAGKRIKITSIAYGKQSDGSQDLNKKKTLNKVIEKEENTSRNIFKNSMVAEEKVDIEILKGAGLDMANTSVTGGTEIKLPPATVNPSEPKRTFPIQYNDVFKSPTFKPNVSLNSRVEANYVAGINHGTSLISKAITLDLNGGTVVSNGVGKFKVGLYDIILVNATELVINSNPHGLSENKTILISSGNITFDMGSSASAITNSNFFGKNIIFKTPGSLNINEAPLERSTPIPGIITHFLTEVQLIEINRVISNYITNWSNSRPEGSGGTTNWQDVESETVYE